MLEEIEKLGYDAQITYRQAQSMWDIKVLTDHGLEQTIGKKFEDAMDALKLRLAKYES